MDEAEDEATGYKVYATSHAPIFGRRRGLACNTPLKRTQNTAMATERARAMRNVFISNTDKLRRELMIEVKDLNSKLISRCLISDAVLREQDIDTTLQEIRGRLPTPNP